MATFNKFQKFVGRLGVGEHNLNTHTIKAYLSNAVPSASDDDIKTDLAEITPEHGYPDGGVDIENTYSEVAGVGTVYGVDKVITAAGGTVGPFQYVVLYNDDHASDALIAWLDYGVAVTLNDGETFTIDFDVSGAVFTVT